jgi:ribosomal protein S18 acetylase RimI-like enzyme
MSISVERAVIADLEPLLLLMRRMQADDPWDETFNEPIVKKNLSELFHNPAFGLVLIARDGQALVAYLAICFDFSLEYHGKGAWVDELFVAPEYRGQGIATLLLELAEHASFEAGAQTLHLEVSHGNPAIELYRRRGFVDHHRYLMTKWLNRNSQ